MKNKRFLFIVPNTSWFGKRHWMSFPYTVGLLSAVVKREGYDVDVIDANLEDLNEEQLRSRLSEIDASVVAISALTLEYKDCVHRSFQIAKEVTPEIVTILGGIYPTLSLDVAENDKNIDFFVRGEGEERLLALLEQIYGAGDFDSVDGLAYRKDGDEKLTIHPFRKRVTELDSLPLPDYSLFDMDQYMNAGTKFTQNFNFRRYPVGQTITSRGCPYKCIFCSSNQIYGKDTVMRSAENVLSEIDMLVNDYGIQELIIVDDNFLLKKQRALDIMQGMIDRKYDLVWKSNNLPIFLMDEAIIDKMKESGCYQASVSIESGSPNTLKIMKKPVRLDKIQPAIDKLKEVDIELISNFVIGFPGETWEDIRQCFRYAEEIDIDYVLFSIATPLPATELYDICQEEDVLPYDFDFETFQYYGFGKGVITTEEFTPFELQVLRAFEWDRINFKTLAKKEKIARMLGISLEELEAWRKETRRQLGVDIKTADAGAEVS